MYYKVKAKTIEFLDSGGQMVRAMRGQIISIDRRSDSKRLIKEGAIEKFDDSLVAITNDFTLNPDANEIDDAPEDVADDTDTKANDEPPKGGDLVQCKIDGAEKIGEVAQVRKDGKVLVQFDKKNKKLLPIDEVEVIG